MTDQRAHVLGTVLGGLLGALAGTLVGALLGAALADFGLPFARVDVHAPLVEGATDTPASMRTAVLWAGAVAGGAIGCPFGGLMGAAAGRALLRRLRKP